MSTKTGQPHGHWDFVWWVPRPAGAGLSGRLVGVVRHIPGARPPQNTAPTWLFEGVELGRSWLVPGCEGLADEQRDSVCCVQAQDPVGADLAARPAPHVDVGACRYRDGERCTISLL